MAIICAQCGQKQGAHAYFHADLGGAAYVCEACRALPREKAIRDAEAYRQRILKLATDVVVTTTPHVDGYRVVRYLGIESVEFVIGTGIFSEVSGSIADFFGARSSAFEKKLQQAKQHAMGALKFVAAEKGANAVIGADMDYVEFSGNRIGLILNGTLVEIVPVAAANVAPVDGEHDVDDDSNRTKAVPEFIRREGGFVSGSCASCGKRSKAPTSQSGQTGKCAHCLKPTVIPV